MPGVAAGCVVRPGGCGDDGCRGGGCGGVCADGAAWAGAVAGCVQDRPDERDWECGLWNDFSGAAVHATQGTGSQQPTVAAGVASGRNAVRFDGVDDFLQTANFAAALSTPMTVFLVWRSASFPSGAHVIMANSGGNNFGFHNDGTTTPRAYLMNGGVVDTYAVSVTDFTVIDVVWNGNSSRYSTNNAAFIAAAAGTTGTTLAGLVLGRVLTAYYWGGWIAEVIVYNRDLAAAEHAEVGRYLCNKYGILTR